MKMKPCKWCNGTGRKIENFPPMRWAGISGFIIKATCPKCYGKGVKV